MIRIEFRFPTNRFHATPWDRAANEGSIEWPPTPWRIGRALLSVWYRCAREDVSEKQIEEIVEALATRAPRASLPDAVASHLRHYMPIGSVDNKSGREKTTKVFDTFLHIEPGGVLVLEWPDIVLSQELRSALALLLSRLSYLGRAESWVDASLVEDGPADEDFNARELGEAEKVPDGMEVMRAMVAVEQAALDRWRARTFEELLERTLAEKEETAREKGKDVDKVKLSKRDREKIDEMLPRRVRQVLEQGTSELQRAGFSSPPGTKQVRVVRPRGFAQGQRAPMRRRQSSSPTAARFAVSGAVRPSFLEVMSVAQHVRSALLRLSDGAPVFVGRGVDREPNRLHEHTYVLPEANGKDGRVTHVTLFAEMGFDDRARRALDGLTTLKRRDGHDVAMVLAGIGHPDSMAGGDLRRGMCPLFSTSDVWVSRTPFVRTRHTKSKFDARGLRIGSNEHDLLRLIELAGLPEPEVEVISSTRVGRKERPWGAFVTHRAGRGARGSRRGAGFRLRFPTAVSGPLAVGFGAHFGLGVFVPEQ